MQSSSRTKLSTKSCGSKFSVTIKHAPPGTLLYAKDTLSDSTTLPWPRSASSALAELRHRVSQSSSGSSAQQQAIQQGIGRADDGSNGSLQTKLPPDQQNFSRIASASAYKEPDAAAVWPGSGMGMAGKAKAGFLGKHHLFQPP